MSKDILFENEANAKMLAGMNKVANAVKSTFGPSGRNVAFTQQYDVPLVTNDGYTIARQIVLEDKFENLGAQLIKEAALKTNQTAGDGTTGSIIIADAIINEAYKNITAGANGIFLKRGIDKATEVVISELERIATPIKDVETIRDIATTAGNNDPEIGDIIARIYDELGFDPVVTTMDTQMADTKLVISHGCRLDSGYLSRYFVTDTVRNICEMDDPYIFICKDEITTIREIYNLLEQAVTNKAPLLIIARDIKGEALTALAANAEKNVLKLIAMKGPGYADTRDRNLSCLAAITGATLVDKDIIDISTVGLEVCGRAKRAVVEKEVATIEGPACPDSPKVLELKKQIEKQLETETGTYAIDKLEQSLGLLNSAMAVIEVGGTSELEMFERKYRIDDALNAASRAAREGTVPGGGKALLLCKDAVSALIDTLSGDEKLGATIVFKALEAPSNQIEINCGKIDATDIVDPATVIKNSFMNAASVAGIYITTGAAVIDTEATEYKTE